MNNQLHSSIPLNDALYSFRQRRGTGTSTSEGKIHQNIGGICNGTLFQVEKDTIDETENEEPSVIDNPFFNEARYFNLFECGKSILNILDAM